MKLLTLTISEISEENKQQRQENKLLREENQLLRQEKRNNNTKVKSLHNETVEQVTARRKSAITPREKK